MSPLTMSYFTAWAFFDVRFGRDGETIGTCLLDVAGLLGMDPFMAETVRRFQGSRMGVYVLRAVRDRRRSCSPEGTGDGGRVHLSRRRRLPGQTGRVVVR